MNEALCKLIFVCPAETAEEVADALLDVEPALPGFTSFEADGHGHDFGMASAKEQVRGRVARRVFWVVLPRADSAHVRAAIAARIHNPHIAFWTEPVLEFGHLSP